MKARKFFKKLISIKWIVAILIVLCLGIVATVYFTVGINGFNIELDNIEFDREGFVNINDKKPSEIDNNKLVEKNEKFAMFIDEDTTIVSVAVLDSLKPGQDGSKVSDYNKVYSSASTADKGAASMFNFELKYSSTNISKPVTDSFNSYKNSVKFKNELTELDEKHYAIKYLNKQENGYNGVQVDYTIGNFGSLNAFFAQKIYTTIYKPARVLYETDEEWNEAVKEWEDDYLPTVGGNLANTFEERFRGNVEIKIGHTPISKGKYDIYFSQDIIVHSEEAFIYLRDTVFPELLDEGIIDELPDLDIEKHTNLDSTNNISWVIKNCPDELLRFDGELYKKYFNNPNSPLTNNPFLTAPTYKELIGAYRLIFADGNTVKYPYYINEIKSGPGAKRIYFILYMNQFSEEYNQYFYENANGEKEEYCSTGFPARDEEGNFLYDEDGRVKKQLYTHELVEKDNKLFQADTEGMPVFKIALEFKLTNKGLEVTVPRNSIIDSTNVDDFLSKDDPDYELLKAPYQVVDIKICPKLTTLVNVTDGYMIVPDGSGAIINFNNGKTSNVSATYYGKDLAYVDGVKTEDPARLLLGMFAFVNTTRYQEGGILGIIKKGAGQVSLNAGTSNGYVKVKDPVSGEMVDTYKTEVYANLIAQLRGREKVKTGTVGSAKEYDKWDKILSPSDIVIDYQILDSDKTSYSAVAKEYRDYIMDRDGIETYSDTTDKIVNDLTFLGTFEKYDLFAGVKYKKSDTLTTFKQAMEIIDYLGENDVKDLSVSYRGWTNEYLEYEVGGSLKVAGKLGHTAGIRSFYHFCVEKQIPFFPELSITTAKGYDYLFGSTKYSTRGVGNEEAVHFAYDLATLRPDKKMSKTYVVAPQFYNGVSTKLMNDFKKLKVWKAEEQFGGFYLTDLGNQWAGNYRKGKQVYGAETILYQQDALDIIAKHGKVKISAPCDYAFKYVDTAVNVPVSSSMYTIYDATIPFYQLVVNGLFDYSTDQINGLSNRSSNWYFAKALESGSNLSYLLSYEDPATLLDTDYTEYYQIYFENWKQFIISSTKIANELGIYDCYLTDHEIINGLSKVTYTKKNDATKQVQLIVNCTDKNATYQGHNIAPYGFYLVPQGN